MKKDAVLSRLDDGYDKYEEKVQRSSKETESVRRSDARCASLGRHVERWFEEREKMIILDFSSDMLALLPGILYSSWSRRLTGIELPSELSVALLSLVEICAASFRH